VRTRTLILLALACGLLILVAGGIQLVRLAASSHDTVDVLELGERAALDGVRVTVVSARMVDGVVDVRVQFDADDGAVLDAEAGWAFLAGGRLRDVTPPAAADRPPCAGTAVPAGTSLECELAFVSPTIDGVISFSREDEQRQWRLDRSRPTTPRAG